MQADHYVHDLDPVLVQIGPLAIRYYSLAYLLGLLIGMWLLRRLARQGRIGLTVEQATDMVIPWALLGVLLGGRLGYVLFYSLEESLKNPLSIVQIWKGGMASHGGILGVIIAMWLFARRTKVPFLHLFDLAAMTAPIGLGLGRIANFINGELWGRTSDVPWAVIFPDAGPDPRHPSQLYQAMGEGLLLYLLLFVLHRKLLPRPGALAALFCFGYSLQRIICEQFREPDDHIGYQQFLGMTATRGQILTGIVIVVGVILATLAWKSRARWSPPEDPDPQTA